MTDEIAKLIYNHPERIGIAAGFKDLKPIHGEWIREIPEMELIHYEKYDYVLIACRSELDYNDLVRRLGIEGKKVSISKRKINARAIWYDKMGATIVPNEEYEKLKKSYTGE